MLGQRLDSVILGVSFNLDDSVILSFMIGLGEETSIPEDGP